MNEFERRIPPGDSSSSTAEPVQDRIKREGSAAADALGDIGEETSRAAGAAGDAATSIAQQAQHAAADHLSVFAQSIRRASDDYREAQPGLVADLMGQAAESVEATARAVGDRNASDLLGVVRDFGRRNPLGMLLASAAVGFAVSRIATAGKSAQGPAPTGSGGGHTGTPAATPASPAAQGGFRNGA